MRLYAELSNIESDIIKLQMITSTLNLVRDGADQSSPQSDLVEAISFMCEQLEHVNANLRSNFNVAWESAKSIK